MTLKNLLLLIGIILVHSLNAQHSISGNMTPAEDLKWLIAYKLNSTDQSYIADAAIKNGAFKLTIPNSAPTGMYRIVYAIPQEEFYFDVIYNGKENIVLSFDMEEGLQIHSSKENIIYHNYFKQTEEIEQEIRQQYANNSPDVKIINELFKQLSEVQKSFESQAKDLISERFIKASRSYIPTSKENVENYQINHKKHFFDAVDFKDPILQESGFLSKKIINFVFNSFPAKSLAGDMVDLELIENIKFVSEIYEPLNAVYKTRIMEDLWNAAIKSNLHSTATFIYENYLRNLALSTNNTDLIHKIDTHNRLKIGAVAPEVTWETEGTTQKLSDFAGHQYYVLVFWSSECSHCLNQLPKLQLATEAFANTKVVAIGLEDDKENWKKEAAKLPNFIHGISLGKWNSPYVITYHVTHTPTYFVLDSEKRFVAKPDSYEEVVAFLNGKQ
ncbi:TlpA family protein disulfide reductase [Arenibacter certesii]|nr:thioredoxin-like domain-containing protein [Arenibacter certesii]